MTARAPPPLARLREALVLHAVRCEGPPAQLRPPFRCQVSSRHSFPIFFGPCPCSPVHWSCGGRPLPGGPPMTEASLAPSTPPKDRVAQAASQPIPSARPVRGSAPTPGSPTTPPAPVGFDE